MDTTTQGARIRELRQRAQISREALAIRAGVSGTTVMRAEQGRPVGVGSIARMLAVLDPDARVADLVTH